MTVSELTQRLTVQELVEWMGYDRLGMKTEDDTPSIDNMRAAFKPVRKQ